MSVLSLIPTGIAPPAAVVRLWKRDIAAGTLLGPRIVAASNIFDGPRPYWPGTLPIYDTTQARVEVEAAKASGADFIVAAGLDTLCQYMDRDQAHSLLGSIALGMFFRNVRVVDPPPWAPAQARQLLE